MKALFVDKNQYRYIPSSSTFDFLPKKNRKYDPPIFYNLPFRIVRFKITDETYETVVTNLNSIEFSPDELKKRIAAARREMEKAARELDFLTAARWRDEIERLKSLLNEK